MAGRGLSATVLVGNPKVGSRTRGVGEAVASTAARGAAGATEVTVIELAELAGDLFEWGRDSVAAAKETVLEADLLVVASPVYKASFTGLLKAFLDHFGRDELAGVPTVPVMVGAALDHALAVELQLRPVLIEIGASCPTRGIFVVEADLDRLDEQLDDWAQTWSRCLQPVLASGRS